MQKEDRFWLDMMQIPRIFPEHVYEILDIMEPEHRPTRPEQLKPIVLVPEGARESHLNCCPPPAPEHKLPRVYTTVGQTIPAKRRFHDNG